MTPNQVREFEGHIKSVQVKGETKVDKDGAVLAEPEIVLTVLMPLTTNNIRAMNFLAACKLQEYVELTVAAPQLAFDFTDAELARHSQD